MVSVADKYRSKAGFTTRIQVLRAPHRPSTCLFRRERGRWSAKGPILGERPALNTAEYIQRQYFVSGRGRRIGQQTASGEAYPRATCRLCTVPFVLRGTPPRAGRQSSTLNFEISKFELKWELAGSPIAASKTAPGFYARPSPINSEGQSAFYTPAYEN
ncbi:hypothetical protein TIFTF001_049927 [Ficus carica]|uniref:Uncharacterized protein n=1 Tax=Ficus carica TaxID=3494 RepID=A0AA87Z5Z5_FICCA|nr:hypothetical protein TIFTF001_049927 [Ficus carica]